MIASLWFLLFFCCSGVLAYHRAALTIWALSFLLLLVFYTKFYCISYLSTALSWEIFLIIASFLLPSPLRRYLFSRPMLEAFRKLIPAMSNTEREALEAGTVSWEGDLFSGMPNWHKLLQLPKATLTPEEKAFLEGPVEKLCQMANDWEISYLNADLPPAIWQFLKEQGFFALIIPKQYGGKEFSPAAHSAILTKIYSRCITLATTVAVPNSLGPAELLLHYGTNAQKNYYLPRLARGEEIPCFALTHPEAGSDASSIPDFGIICRDEFNGEKIIGIRLTWEKRYITLAPVATVIGLAFKLYDPQHLIGDTVDLGITCALIPSQTTGVNIGRRHLPGGAPFQNGPTSGQNVFIPISWIIGGVEMAGQGWRMLMECLSAGRAISLPASALGGSKLASFASGAYARIRKQFNQSIGRFEGIEEALAMIGGYTYIIDAGIKFTMAALNTGAKPAVASALMKYHSTELSRIIANHTMDIHGGKGICLGPRNYLANLYQSSPISITVEGANILTRCLIIFGQGVIRCHPYILTELQSAQQNVNALNLKKFDKVIFAHAGFILSNGVRSVFLGLSDARWVQTPGHFVKRYFQLLTRYSTCLALCADMAMLALGAKLKRKEKLSARLGDILSLLYLGSAILKCYADEDFQEEDKPLVDWTMQTILFNIQQHLHEFLRNLPQRPLAYLLRLVIFPLGRKREKPSDHLGGQIAAILINQCAARTRLTQGIYITNTPHNNNLLATLEATFAQVIAAEPLEKRLALAVKGGTITGRNLDEQTAEASAKGIINNDEAQQLKLTNAARRAVIAVDDFAATEVAKCY